MTDTTQSPLENQPLIIVKPEEISKAYELPDAKIAEIKAFCDNINIAGLDDKTNYKTASTALSKVKKFRTGIEAKRKQLKEPFLEAGKAIDAEAKRLTALLTPIETALAAKIKVIDDAAHQAEMQRRQHLHEQMFIAGYKMEANVFIVGRKIVAPQTVWDATDEQLTQIIQDGLAEVARLEAEAKEREEMQRKLAELEAAKQKEQAPPPQAQEPFNEGTPHKFMAPQDTDMFANIPPVAPTPKQEPTAPASTTTPIEQFRPGYLDGFNSCRARVLEILNSPEKLTRAQWIDKIERIKP